MELGPSELELLSIIHELGIRRPQGPCLDDAEQAGCACVVVEDLRTVRRFHAAIIPAQRLRSLTALQEIGKRQLPEWFQSGPRRPMFAISVFPLDHELQPVPLPVAQT